MVSLRGFQKDYLRQNFSIDYIVEVFKEWASEATYMILSKLNLDKLKNEVFAVKCAKRGNDVYKSRVKTRFSGLVGRTHDLVFFIPKDRTLQKQTSALWVTLTYDTKLCSYQKAWEQIGIEFNAFMSHIRRNFGKVSCCRVFESFENGYPHIHAFYYLKNTSLKHLETIKVNLELKKKTLSLRVGTVT